MRHPKKAALSLSLLGFSFAFFIVLASFSLKLCADPTPFQTSVLFIGDSHAEGTFGSTLDDLLRSRFGESVATFGVGGSTPAWWQSGQRTPWGYFERLWNRVERRTLHELTPHADALISKYHPRVIIVELGTNLIWNPFDRSAEEATENLMAMIEAKAPGRCFWVGPPALGNLEKLFVDRFHEIRKKLPEMMSRHPKCTYIDSTAVTYFPDNVGDRIHFNSWPPEGVTVAKTWATEVMKAIENRLQRSTHP